MAGAGPGLDENDFQILGFHQCWMCSSVVHSLLILEVVSSDFEVRVDLK